MKDLGCVLSEYLRSLELYSSCTADQKDRLVLKVRSSPIACALFLLIVIRLLRSFCKPHLQAISTLLVQQRRLGWLASRQCIRKLHIELTEMRILAKWCRGKILHGHPQSFTPFPVQRIPFNPNSSLLGDLTTRKMQTWFWNGSGLDGSNTMQALRSHERTVALRRSCQYCWRMRPSGHVLRVETNRGYA
jgi:hypothetical protein